MTKEEFQDKYKNELQSLWKSGFGDLFFINGVGNEIFDNEINENDKTIEIVTGLANINSLNDLFLHINNRNDLILSEGISSFINMLKFKLINEDEFVFLPLDHGVTFSLKFYHYPERKMVILSIVKITNFFNYIDEYLQVAYRNSISGLFNMNLYQKHLTQIDEKTPTYVGVYHIANLYKELHVIDGEKIISVVKGISRILYDESYSKVCVYHLKDNEYVVKITDMDMDKASELFERINTKILSLDIDGYRPKTCLGYLKFDLDVCDNIEMGRFAYLSVMLAHQSESSICYLCKYDILKLIEEHGTALQTVNELGLLDY